MDLDLLGPLGAAAGAVAGAAAGAAAGALTRLVLRRRARVTAPGCVAGAAVLGGGLGLLLAGGLVAARWVPLLAVLCWLAAAGTSTDLAHRRLPNVLTLPALPLVLVAAVPAGAGAVLRGAAGAVLLAGAYAAVHLVSPAAMGAGDVKLAGPVGAAVTAPGWAGLPVAAALAVLLSGVVAVLALVAGRARWAGGLPHGPALLGAALAVLPAAVVPVVSGTVTCSGAVTGG
ncbi:A24 family peptidase [Pseudonocardia kongjuensis]|uniref:A24 family peptidase n=1 Tax=Pseudonocardia kongjuensis TaxID=102227 RepID=UPI0031E45CB6